MVFVKVRETYDLHTVASKMSLIAIHTPHPEILIRNYPGLLMQCKAFRPVSCDVRVACASVLPMDPAGVGTEAGDVAPEDLFNPILYKATSNIGMSQIEARIFAMQNNPANDVNGPSVNFDNDSATTLTDEFNVYYGLLSDTHGWKHANPQSGLQMTDLRPLVYEMLYNVGDNQVVGNGNTTNNNLLYINSDDTVASTSVSAFRGSPKPLPWINCTFPASGTPVAPGFGSANNQANVPNIPTNPNQGVPNVQVMVGAIIIPPSRLHTLYYRMVCEWTVEFSGIRSINEITNFDGLAKLGATSHYQSYSYGTAKSVLGVEGTNLTSDTTMVSANVDINKVM